MQTEKPQTVWLLKKVFLSLRNFIFDMDKLPFIFGKSSDLLNFANREEESLRLEMYFKSLINTTIISPIRWGKTSLVEDVMNKIRTENKKKIN